MTLQRLTLLDHGADMSARDCYGHIPLRTASADGHISVVKLLLDRGCAVNALENNGDTALHSACWNGHTKCVEKLVVHGADATIKNKAGKTPLDYAKRRNHQTIIQELLTVEELPTVEPKKCAEQNHLFSKKNTKKSIISEANVLCCEELRGDMNQIVGASRSDLASINPRNEELHDIGVGNECKIKKSLETLETKLSSTMEGHLSSIFERQCRCEEILVEMARNQEEMKQTLQRLILDNTDSNQNVAFDVEGKLGAEEKVEKDSLSIQEELQQGLEYCQTMLS